MSQSNENKEKQNNKTDEERLLQVVKTFERCLLFMGFLVMFCAYIVYFSPGPQDNFVALPVLLFGLATVLTYSAMSMMRTRMLERFREIDELKKEVQELKNILTQK